jgi:hypothetical protein
MPKEDELIRDWLLECRAEATRSWYRYSLQVFQEWHSKPITKFLALEPREMRHTALKFQSALQSGWTPKDYRGKGKFKPNSIINFLIALGSFCTFNDKPLRLHGKRLRRTVDVTSHSFTTQDLSRMLNVANVQQKAILSTLCSLGWEVSAILALDKTAITTLIQKAVQEHQNFIYFTSQRRKTGAVRLGVLNPVAIEWLTSWLKTAHEPHLFTYTTKEGINLLIKHLARDAQILTTGRVHTHKIRAWVISGLSRAGLNEFQIKYVVGKTIPMQDFTYLETLRQEVEERYPQAYAQYLDISGKTPLGVNQSDLDTIRQLLPYLRQLTPEHMQAMTELLAEQRKREQTS